jgi:muramoyltetrapeptide carboxypeptidase
VSGVRPRALRRGDLVGVCAASGPVDAAALDKGVGALRDLGFEVRVPPSLLERRMFTAGTAARRRDELQTLFADSDVAGIVCARGGAGAAQLLAGLDVGLLRAHPKVFIGYSDVTFLHLLLHQGGLVTFHGPMVAREWADGGAHLDSFRAAVLGEGLPYVTDADELEALRTGTGEGLLRGGCLSILAAAAGTPWAFHPDPEGTILFLEDVDERPYRTDRLLFQLRASGALAGVRGIVFGDMKGCAPAASDDYRLEDVIGEALAGLEVPIAIGLSSGHTTLPNVTLPLGVRARLSCEGGAARFEVLEAAVS